MIDLRLCVLLLCGSALAVLAEEEVLLDVPQGAIKGLKTSTVFHKKPYFSFKGIPYAKPNVGPNKFRVPEPAESWEGVYDATQFRSSCPYYCMIRQGLFGEEDCLYLNVYTPTVDKEARKAVMVWFHPGGFNAGSGEDDVFGPDFLIEQDVVIVTMNYRLGPVGFLNTLDANAPGNAGLKDQTMALKWVKDNIQYFGGCPKRVTIFGQSSGSASVQYHMVSPMSEGLFKGAILQSGAAVNSWAISYDPKDAAFKLGEALGVKTSDTNELVEKLKVFPAKEIVDAAKKVSETLNGKNGRMFAFVPSVEANVGQERFLPTDPWVLLKSGRIMDVPAIVGVTRDEATLFSDLPLENADSLNDNFEMFLPADLNVTDANKAKELAESMKKFYFKDKQLSKDTAEELVKMMTDVLFVAGVGMSTKVIKARNSEPVYEYLFNYEAPFGIIKNLLKKEKGVAHGDDLGYEFYSNAFKNLPQAGSPAEKMTRIFTKLWTNFAKDGNPTSKLDDDVTLKWEPMGKENNYMLIDQELKMDKNLFADRMDFWTGLYKDVLGEYADS